jgi:1,4-dihydroxy-2-naphthoate octaprenyltransferase
MIVDTTLAFFPAIVIGMTMPASESYLLRWGIAILNILIGILFAVITHKASPKNLRTIATFAAITQIAFYFVFFNQGGSWSSFGFVTALVVFFWTLVVRATNRPRNPRTA